MSIRFAVAALAAALTLSGCGSSPQDHYLSLSHGTSYAGDLSDADLMKLGHMICGQFDDGHSWIDVIGSETTAGFTGYQAGEMTGLAVRELCPSHVPALPRT